MAAAQPSLAALGQMAAQMAHEIRNPLNAIEGFASLLLRDLDPADQRSHFAQNIVAAARNLNRIVTQMLLFCQPRSLQTRAVSLRAILEGALAFVEHERRHLGLQPLEIERHYDPRADTIDADPEQLGQAFLNLLLNAAQAMDACAADPGRSGPAPAAGQARPAGARSHATQCLRIAVRAARDGAERVRISVRDFGPGIPDPIRQKVFDPFFTTKAGGTGLGLTIVQTIVEFHGGQLELRPAADSGERAEGAEDVADSTPQAAGASTIGNRTSDIGPVSRSAVTGTVRQAHGALSQPKGTIAVISLPLRQGHRPLPNGACDPRPIAAAKEHVWASSESSLSTTMR